MAAIATQAHAFEIKGFGGSQTYKDGDVINCGCTMEMAGMYFYNPELTVHSSTEANITSTAVLTANVTPAPLFCGGGLCESLEYNVPAVKKCKVTASSPIDLQLDIAMSSTPVEETVPVTLTVTDGAQTMTLYVNFVKGENAIDAVGVKNSISVNGRTLNYSVDTPTSITLYTISGQSAITRTISGTGTLDLQNIPAGVYIYRTASRTGKIVVK